MIILPLDIPSFIIIVSPKEENYSFLLLFVLKGWIIVLFHFVQIKQTNPHCGICGKNCAAMSMPTMLVIVFISTKDKKISSLGVND